MDRGLLAAVVLSLTLSGSGCSEERSAGPQVVNWNTDTCERCRMVLSDPKYAAQVRFRAPEGRSQVRLFDDLGCAVLWLEDKPFREAASTEIWVTDWRRGDWIDAQAATYVPGQRTPMGYGLGAQPESGQAGLNFAQARARILASERGSHRQGMHFRDVDGVLPAGSERSIDRIRPD